MAERLPWVEKYRPKKVSDVSHQGHVVKTLTSALETGNIPHLLFYGAPGTGKTSTMLALAKQMYGEYFKERVLELNASDERGISVVREKIKNFASRAVAERSINGVKIPSFKFIILDEADSMTKDAQSALRRTMEIYTKVTRFCLICNYVSRIIEPIASRCAKFRFQPLSDESMKERFIHICTEEKVKYDQPALDSLIQCSEGDMRRAITMLQSASEYNDRNITTDLVGEISGVIPSGYFVKLKLLLPGRNFGDLQLFADGIVLEGFATDVFFDQLFDMVIIDDNLNDQQKSVISLVLANASRNLAQGASAELQLLAVLSDVFRLYKQSQPDIRDFMKF